MVAGQQLQQVGYSGGMTLASAQGASAVLNWLKHQQRQASSKGCYVADMADMVAVRAGKVPVLRCTAGFGRVDQVRVATEEALLLPCAHAQPIGSRVGRT